jgi:glutamate racemase
VLAAQGTTHLVITDSGLGGLSVCAQLERMLGESTASPMDVRLTFLNAWPEDGQGYNDLADVAARARVFDRVLRRIGEMHPDLLLIACNTLSIIYESTEFRLAPAFPVEGIVDVGVDLFQEALLAAPQGSIVLLGTRTTIESGVHRSRLIERRVSPERIAVKACHGLATAIEHGPASEVTSRLIDTCAADAAAASCVGDPLFVGLCCTHYGMVGERIAAAVAGHSGRNTVPLDPNARFARNILSRVAGASGAPAVPPRVVVKVISKVQLTADQRNGIGDLLERISPATADALRSYTHVPDLF